MQVGVMKQVLPPGVEDGEEADMGTEMLWIGGDGDQRFGGGAKEHVVDSFLVLQGNASELVGESEHDVEILYRQQFVFALLEPAGVVEPLALGTVAVAAGIVGDAGVSALAALFDVATQLGGAAGFNGTQRAKVFQGEAVGLAVSRPVTAHNVSQFQCWP